MRLLTLTLLSIALLMLISCTDGRAACLRVTDNELNSRVHMEFSDDGNQLAVWTSTRVIFFDIQEGDGGCTAKISRQQKLPSSVKCDIEIAYASLYPLYNSLELIPPSFGRLRNAIELERSVFVDSGLSSTERLERKSFTYKGAYRAKQGNVLLCGKEFGFTPLYVSSSGTYPLSQIGYVGEGSSLSRCRSFMIATDRASLSGIIAMRYNVFHNGNLYWTVRTEDYWGDGKGSTPYKNYYSYISPTGQFALMQILLPQYIKKGFHLPGGKGFVGDLQDKYVYLVANITEKKVIYRFDLFKLSGRPCPVACAAIDEVHRRLALYNRDSNQIEIRTF